MMSVKRRSSLLPYALLTPTLALILALGLYPFIYVIYLSFMRKTAADPSPIFVGLANYVELFFGDRTFRDVFSNTLIYVATAVSAEFLLGLGLALFFNREFKGRRIIVPLVYVPMIVTPVAVGLTFRIIYNVEYGPLNYLISLMGVQPVKWVASAKYSLISLILVDIWEWTPFMFLVLLAGLQSIPRECVEAGLLDGAGYWQRFRYISLHFIKGSIMVALLIRMIDAFKSFDIIYTVTEGGPGTSSAVISFLTYIQGFRRFNLGYAAAMSLVLFLLILAPSQVLFRSLRRRS
ncbi:MAG: sugar ABC transporter permease [Candidatus Bathyarchaeia archaeon]